MNVSLYTTHVGNETIKELGTVGGVPRWSEMLLTVFLIMTAILGVSGNSLIVLVESKNLFKTSTDWLVAYMATTDIIFALINIPIYVLFHVGCWEYVGSDAGCMIHLFIEKSTMLSSSLSLCTVAADRYLKTCRPHSKFLTPEHAFRACAVIMAVSILSTTATFTSINYNKDTFCSQNEATDATFNKIIHGLFIASFVVMFVLVSVFYARVAYAIKRRLVRKQLSLETVGVTSCSSSTRRKTTSGWLTHLQSRNKVSPIAKGTSPVSALVFAVTLDTSSELRAKEAGNTQGNKSPDHAEKDPSSYQDRSVKNQGVFTTSKMSKPAHISEKANKLTLKEKCTANARKDRTTKIMFAVTLVFILSWMPTWIIYLYKHNAGDKLTVEESVVILFGGKLFMVNTFMNPIFYILMSSVFRQRTKMVIKTLLRCKSQKKLHR